jgi:hypothetical protein
MDFVLRGTAFIGRVISAPLHGAAEKSTEELIKVVEEEAGKC